MKLYFYRTVWAIGWLFLISKSMAPCRAQVVQKKQVILMGSRFEITLTGDDPAEIERQIAAVIEEITRIENLISEWKPSSQISEVNRNAGIQPVKVDREVWELTRRALDYSEWSGGAFDISVAGLDNLWKFDGSMTDLPSPESVRESRANVGYQQLVLDRAASTIFLRHRGMKIGFGSIGKGYAADRGRELMQAMGVKGGIVNAAGDLSTWGHPPGKRVWKIGIAHPVRPSRILKVLKLKEGAVATSGDYQKYVEIDGTRYSHIIDPRTGYPSKELASATVIGPSAEFANALSTSVMVLGIKEGQKLMGRFPEYHYLFVTKEGRVFRR